MRQIDHPWRCSQPPYQDPIVAILDNGHIYVLSDAGADADGAPNADVIDKKHGQLHTSLRRSRGWQGLDGSKYVNALTIPYFVLPGNWKEVTGIVCTPGDIAKLSVGDLSIFAIYADVGGDESIGEASVRTIVELGGDPWRDNQIRRGLEFGVMYEIIPGSAKLEVTRSFEEIQEYGRLLFP